MLRSVFSFKFDRTLPRANRVGITEAPCHGDFLIWWVRRTFRRNNVAKLVSWLCQCNTPSGLTAKIGS